MKSKVLYILKIVGITLIVLALTGYAVFAAVMAGKWRAERVCEAVKINILDYDRYQFICEDDITHAIEKSRLNPIGKVVTSNDADRIEKCIERINVIKTAECYVTSNGDIIISVTQRKPQFRVNTDLYSYYIDDNRLPMKTKGVDITITPVVTGNISEDEATGGLYELVTYIQDNKFWNELIYRIDVTNDNNIELYTTKGAGKVILDNIDTYKEKLHDLELWYDQYGDMAWSNRYTTVNLRFDNLIYCKKGDNNE